MDLRGLSRTLVVATISAAALAGCGSSSPPSGDSTPSADIQTQSPAKIVAASQQAAQSYTTVLASGLVPDDGPARVDLHFARGKGAVGTISYGPYILEVVQIGQIIYLNSKHFVNFYETIAGSTAGDRFRDVWIRASVDSAGLIGTLGRLTQFSNLTRGFFGRSGEFSTGATVPVDGVQTLEIKNDATGEVLYVAASGTPHPYQILMSGASTSQGITFDEWNEPVSISAPPNAIAIEKIDAKA